MGQIRWTSESVSWLEKIHDYISIDKPQTAQKIINDIYDKVSILKKFPKMGHRLSEYSDLHIRVLLYGHYRIAYLIKENEDIDILGVFHGAMDIKKYLASD